MYLFIHSIIHSLHDKMNRNDWSWKTETCGWKSVCCTRMEKLSICHSLMTMSSALKQPADWRCFEQAGNLSSLKLYKDALALNQQILSMLQAQIFSAASLHFVLSSFLFSFILGCLIILKKSFLMLVMTKMHY